MAKEYREVKRKAQVGERIRIVNADDTRYANGDEFSVSEVDEAGVWIKHPEGQIDGCAGVFHFEYAVLEEVPEAAASLADTAMESPAQPSVILCPDPSLNGIQREYTQEKRKANVGELIVNLRERADYPYRHVAEVTDVDGYGSAETTDIAGDTRTTGAEYYEVLTPIDVIHIGNERFRIVERKAAAGERVVVITPANDYKAGSVETVRKVTVNGANKPVYSTEGPSFFYLPIESTATLEPVVTSATPSAPTSQEDVVAALTVRLSRLQREFDEYKAESDAQFTEIATQLGAKDCGGSCGCASGGSYVKVASGPVTNRIPSFITRDDVVQQAIADVKALLNRNYPFSPTHLSVWFSDADGSFITDKCEFVVSREKRTVVALISTLGGHVIHRGIAKCAPGDVFNTHIGRAIALRRALGLAVPQEYVKCPQPAEGDARVGDIIRYKDGGRVAKVCADSTYIQMEYETYLSTARDRYCENVVIDDSARYDLEVSA